MQLSHKRRLKAIKASYLRYFNCLLLLVYLKWKLVLLPGFQKGRDIKAS
jgi:hypothetical protein